MFVAALLSPRVYNVDTESFSQEIDMRIQTNPNANRITKRPAAAPKTEENTTLGLSDTFHSLPRWPKAAVQGIGTYAPAGIGAAIGSQYGFIGKVAGAAVGGLASYNFQSAIGAHPRQAKISAGLSTVFAVFGGASLSPASIGINVAFSAGIGMVQELARPQ